MTRLNIRLKLGRAVTLMKYLTSVVSFIFLPKSILRRVSPKNLPISRFLSDLSLLIEKISRAYK